MTMLASIVAVGAGCAIVGERGEDVARVDGEIRPGERVMIGAAIPYAADLELDRDQDRLTHSQRSRREAAWRAVAKILADTDIAEPAVQIPDGPPDATTPRASSHRPRLPVFRTWYQKDDLERMFARTYERHGADARRARQPFAPPTLDEAFAFNATDRGELTLEQYFERVAEIDTNVEAQGLGGNARVSYSPAMLRHVMANYARLSKCARGEVADDPLAEPATPTNFTTCLDAEFPKDAALIKASWLRSDFDLAVPIRPTTPDLLKARLAGELDDGGWGDGNGEASPDDSSIYTVRMSDGATFRLPALHLITKELRHWMWISIWWSPDPDTDFGADRPDAIRALGGPWKNYKMCVVTDYAEGDPQSTGGFPTGPGSLGDALAAVYGGVGAPSWCSNPYIERGAKNARTNCIGCHQHGGTALQTEDVLADPVRFPSTGRTSLRKNFPTDYLFAATSAPESLAQIIDAQVARFDTIDGPPATH